MAHTKPKSPPPQHHGDSLLSVNVAYYIVWALLVLGMLFPRTRLWGVNWYAYWPAWVSYIVLLIAAAVPVAVGRMRGRSFDETATEPTPGDIRQYWLASGIGCGLLAASFFLLRSKTFFLGDGYQLLQRLADHVPPVKSWDMITSKLHYGLFALLGGRTDDQALLTYQLVSWGSGILVLAMSAVAARLLFERNRERLLFLFGVISSGFMLLYFGYVEHYALFNAVLLGFAVLGMLVSRGLVNKSWLLVPLVLAPLLHIFGVLLIPAAAYLLLRETPVGAWLRRVPARTKLLILLAALLLGVAVYYYFYSHYLFFRFAIIPLFADRFTAEGETLLAPRRLLDLGNLLLMLLPGLPLLVAAGSGTVRSEARKRPEVRFLLILLMSTLGSTFIFNPKLGLPRDWDLFAFGGLPLALVAYGVTLQARIAVRRRVTAVLLSICLGLVLLGPRVMSQFHGPVAAGHFEDYLNLDRVKGKNAWLILMEYYRSIHNDARVDELTRQFDRTYPEMAYNQNASRLINEGKFGEALVWARQALAANPLLADAWSNLGLCYLDAGQPDSAEAMLRIADGMNPYSPVILNNLGTAYFRTGRLAEAVDVLHRVLQLDSTLLNAHINLTAAFHMLGQEDSSYTHLERLEHEREVGPLFFQRFGDFYCEKGRFDLAAQTYRIALQQGMDSSHLQSQQAKYPQLGH